MSWCRPRGEKDKGGLGKRPGKGIRRGRRRKKTAARREQELERCANSPNAKKEREAKRQALERAQRLAKEYLEREQQREADMAHQKSGWLTYP